MMHRLVSKPELCESGAHAKPCIATHVGQDPTPYILANMGPSLRIWQGNGVGWSGSFLEEERWSSSWHGDVQHGG